MVGNAAELVQLPNLSARVTDLTGMLDANGRAHLEAKLAAMDGGGRLQIAVLLLPSTQPETIEQFGIRLAEAWKIGQKGEDRGLIIVVATNDKSIRIEIGNGLKDVISKVAAKRIIDERMGPRFSEGNILGGLDEATQALAGLISGDSLSPGDRARYQQLAEEAKRAAQEQEHFYWVLFSSAGAILAGLVGVLFLASRNNWGSSRPSGLYEDAISESCDNGDEDSDSGGDHGHDGDGTATSSAGEPSQGSSATSTYSGGGGNFEGDGASGKW